MHLKRCSVQLCDIRLKPFPDSSSLFDMIPTAGLKLTEMNAEKNNKLVPLDDICIALKRKRTDFNMLNQNKENEESESSEEEEICEKPRKKIVRIIEEKKEESDPDYDPEMTDYKENSNVNHEDSDLDENYEVHKVVNAKKKSKINDVPKPKEKNGMSSYEKMIEKNKAERLAFLQSLKINEVKSEFCDVVNTNKLKMKCLKKPAKRPAKMKEPLPLRKSRRLANMSADFSEDKLFENAMKNALQNEANNSSLIPSELTFTEALGSEELYKAYTKDINIQELKPTGNDFSYNRSVLRKLSLDDSNIAKVVRERISSLTWYPSADNLILAAGSKYGNVGIWNVDSESNPHVFKIHNQGITNLQFNPYDPVQLFSSCHDGTLRCGDMIKHVFNEVYNISDETGCIYFDFVSPTTYIVALRNGQVALLDRRNTRSAKPCEKKHNCHLYSVKSVNVHPVNKNYFVTAESKGAIRVWDLRKLQTDPIVDIRHNQRCVNSAFFSPVTGNSILTTSFDDSISILDSTNLTQDIRVTRKMKHNNNTGRWLTMFRATWLPNSDETFVVGSMQDSPRRIQVFDKDLNVYHLFIHENLTTITSVNIFHPLRPALAGSNSSGKVFVFT